MCVVTENALGVGVTVLPDPRVDVAWDGWFVFETGWVTAFDGTMTGNEGDSWDRRLIDSKAMRKTHATDVIAAVFSVREEATAMVEGFLSTRMLGKLA